MKPRTIAKQQDKPATPSQPKRGQGKDPRQPARRRAKKDGARIEALLLGLDSLYPAAECELSWRTPLELLVAVILSAQCTDRRVNLVTPALFVRYPDAAALAAADPAELEAMIHSTGFFRMKAKHIKEACARIVREHGGEVPRTMEDLLKLPGVARKSANVVLGTAYGVVSGVVVDTHIKRLSGRLGLSSEHDPEKIEVDLMRHLPKERWIQTAHQLVWHGRRVCDARRPRCEECALAPLCPSAERVPVATPTSLRATRRTAVSGAALRPSGSVKGEQP